MRKKLGLMHRIPLLLSALLLLTHCGQTTWELGAVPEDEVQLSERPTLFGHYLGTLEGAEQMQVRDLYEREQLTFTGAPTPTELLQSQYQSEPPLAPNARTVRLLTYNVGLLDAKLFGLVPYTATPDLEARAPILFERVLAEGYDIIVMQEVWRQVDVERLQAAAEVADYWVSMTDRSGSTDGLAIAVKKSLTPAAPEVGGQSYDVPSSGLEFFPAPGLNRGFMWVRFGVEGLGRMVAYNTHASAFPESYPHRMSNVRQLGLHLSQNTTDDELVFLGGDMNAGSYYRRNDWTLPDGTVQSVWFANTLSYPLMLHYGELVDLALRGSPSLDAATNDIRFGDQVPAVMDEAYCEATPDIVFTATDCNALYRQQYEGTEFPARMDILFTKDPKGRVHVTEAPLAFVEPIEYAGKTGPLSDHYGQAAIVHIAP